MQPVLKRSQEKTELNFQFFNKYFVDAASVREITGERQLKL